MTNDMKQMSEFLVRLGYHDPETYELWNRGIVEDFEASTGLFITAVHAEAAIAWGEVVALRLLKYVHDSTDLTYEQFQHECSVVADPENSCWSHCLGFFQHVSDGQMPELERMTGDAYQCWMDSQ